MSVIRNSSRGRQTNSARKGFRPHLEALESRLVPALSINDAVLFEGTGGTVQAVFAVNLSAPAIAPVTVQYATADDTAHAHGDYQPVRGTLTFPSGEMSAFISVPVFGDATDEPDETFFVRLSSPMNDVIADGLGVGTIVDDDLPPALSINDASVVEGDVGNIKTQFEVQLSAPSENVVVVNYTTVDATATSPADYQATSGALVFAPGETSHLVVVRVNGDTLREGNETFLVSLSNPVNA